MRQHNAKHPILSILFIISIVCFSNIIGLSQPTAFPPEMIFVEGDTFSMGCTIEQGSIMIEEGFEEGCKTEWAKDELPIHEVSLKQFYISKYEVTQSQWSAVMPNDTLIWNVGIGPSFPVYQVSWYDAVTFCNRLSIQEGFTPCYYSDVKFEMVFDSLVGRYKTKLDVYWDTHADGYRLPTEAEWEFAARGGAESNQYPFSGNKEAEKVAVFVKNNPTKGGKEVGNFSPNELGIYDMSGNEWEWVWDYYIEDYYAKSPECQPIGPTWSENKVCRGGNWKGSRAYIRVANRIGLYPGLRTYNIGFRICRGKMTAGYCMKSGT